MQDTKGLALRKNMGTLPIADVVSKLVIEVFHKLREWCCWIKETLAWKFAHPATPERVAAILRQRKTPEDMIQSMLQNPGFNYECAMRFNFDDRELEILVECVGMIKSLGDFLRQSETQVSPLVRMYTHHVVQQLVQGDIIASLHRTDKNKRPLLTTLLRLRTLGADWTDGIEPKDDYKKYSLKQGDKTANHPVRTVGPSSSQLTLIRHIVRALFDEAGEGRKKRGIFGTGKKDLETADVNKLQAFYSESMYFPYLLDFSGTIHQVRDSDDDSPHYQKNPGLPLPRVSLRSRISLISGSANSFWICPCKCSSPSNPACPGCSPIISSATVPHRCR